MIAAALAQQVEHALAVHAGGTQRLREAAAVGGGCISNATHLQTQEGSHAFLKWGKRGEFATGLFQSEANSLARLAAADAVRVPRVIAARDEFDAEFSWLLLEWLEPGRITSDAWHELGRGLAMLHRVRAERFGWDAPNFIGSLPQQNAWSADWSTFWRDQRITPQLQAARTRLGNANVQRIEKLLDVINDFAAAGNQDGASLLHGDLWGGNVHGLASGQAALIDPSSYYGHREVDLAMAKLFGGFDSSFFDAYEEAWPLLPEHEQRVSLYQLYYMLVHVNLFGGSYVAGSMSLVRKLGF